MSDWNSAATFGQRDEMLPLRVRPSAYAIVRNTTGEIVLVQTPSGCHLPGGGADPGETVERTVQREVAEEVCLQVAIGTWRRRAIEHVPAIAEGASFEKRSTFCDARVIRETGLAGEPDHCAVWVAPRDAVARLTRGSHRWAVMEWLEDRAATSDQRDRPYSKR